ncbi:MAG: dihydrodipicolinate reductase [Myxococcota bacterium]
MTYRVIQWATGNVGRSAIEGILSHPELELAGVWVHSPEKVGRDAGEICGRAPVGVSASDDVDALLALEADCLLYSPLLPQSSEVIRILEAGVNIVTPMGWFYPFHTAGHEDIQAACLQGGVTLHGTGIHPGGITERFPLMVSALSRDIRHVRAEEFSDIRAYRAKGVVREVMLFGKTPGEAARSPMLDLLSGGFGQSIDMISDTLGFALDPEKRKIHEMAVATRPIDTPVGVLEAGTVAAQRFTWQGLVRDEPVITVRVNWLMGQEHLDPPWSFGEEGERFEVEILGTPPVHLAFHGIHPPEPGVPLDPNPGIAATAMHCVNAIPATCAAAPGIRSYLDLPLISGRADPNLALRPAATASTR